MAWSIALSGLCVGVEFRPYDFKDADTNRQISGNSVLLAISESFDSEPVKVKVPTALQESVQALDPYSPVEVEANLFARQRGRSEPFIEAVCRVLVAVDPKTGKRTDLATGEVLPDPQRAAAGA